LVVVVEACPKAGVAAARAMNRAAINAAHTRDEVGFNLTGFLLER
jgi:hypothetical protein